MMKTSNILFLIGVVLLFIGLAVDSYVWYTFFRPEVQVGIIGDIPWTTMILGIILTSLEYWKKQ